MNLLVAGKHNKVIAKELAISVRTAEAHRAKVMKKLRAESLSDIVRLAMAV
jgi:two-component system response regulator FixJ